MAQLLPPRPLAVTDDRASFDCGRESVNQWFWRHAWRNHAGNISRVTVVATEQGAIAGYMSLTAGQIERGHLPRAEQRNRPAAIPIVLLGQLGVDCAHQGRGLASSLLQVAVRTALIVSETIGAFALVTHPLDDTSRTFYAQRGFVELPGDPRAMVIRMEDVRPNLP